MIQRRVFGVTFPSIPKILSRYNSQTLVEKILAPPDAMLQTKRHTAAHIMAMAVQKLFPSVQVTIGPAIEHGFYYDFCFGDKPLQESDLEKIKKEMDNIIKSKLKICKEVVTREEIRKRIQERKETYKLEILDDIPVENDGVPNEITVYHIEGNQKYSSWWDLCSGPHVEHTGHIDPKALELMSIAGAYWRGDEKLPMLTRIYGTLWNNAEELKAYKDFLAESKRRDHRTLGTRLGLFSLHTDSAGGGLVFWHAKGAVIRRLIEDYWKQKHMEKGYELVYTPHMANLDLWKTSGHADFYKNDMFNPITVQDNSPQLYQIRPMNCPFHCLLYKNNGAMRSYKEFPIRMAELGTVYRYERSGTLHGLFRVRGFTQDDAHIFCLPSQLTDEIIGVLKLSFEVLKKFRFHDYKIMLSTRPEGNNSVGSDELWTKATDALVQGLTALNVSYEVDPGAGAFYGPKIDIKVRDAIGRYWQCTTIQCDFNLPQRFQLEYVDASNQVHQPIMIHRAIFGSLERFFGVLIESTAGNFPLWLAPVQCRIMNITDDVADYGHEVCNQLKAAGIRAEIVAAHEQGGVRINKQIKMAEEDKIPFQIVIGKSEKEKGQVALRYHRIGSIGPSLPLAQGVQLIKESIAQSESPNAVDPDSADHWKHWFEQS